MSVLAIRPELGIVPYPVSAIVHQVLYGLGVGQDLRCLLGIPLDVNSDKYVKSLRPFILSKGLLFSCGEAKLGLAVFCG